MTIADVKDLEIPEKFGCDDDNMETGAIDYVLDQLDDTVDTTWGASKFVIFFDGSDQIVKIPFSGEYCWNDDIEDEDFYDFNTSDYCAIEASLYADAVVRGVEKFFARTIYGGVTKKGTPYYISDKVQIYGNMISKLKTPSEENIEKAKKYWFSLSYHTDLNKEWIAYALEWYGEEEVEKLMNFISDENIYDLHNNNVGFRENGAPVILDYSGFDS